MKKILLLMFVSLCIISCKKCYQCTTTQTTTPSSSFLPNTTVQTEFCGTAKEMNEYESAGTTTATSGNITVKNTTTCN
jgi:hypothetical protein